MNETDREETSSDARKVDGPVVLVSIVVPLSSSGTGPDDVFRGRVPTFSGGEFLEFLLAKATEGVGLAVDASEEEVLLKVKGSIALKTASGAETLDACLHAPGDVSGESLSMCDSSYSANGTSLKKLAFVLSPLRVSQLTEHRYHPFPPWPH